MQIWTFSKHHIFKYDFWEKTRYSNMNFWCFLVTPGIQASKAWFSGGRYLDRSQPLFYFAPQEKGLIRRPPWTWKNIKESIFHLVTNQILSKIPQNVWVLGEKSNLPYFSIPRRIAVLDCDSHSQAGSTRRYPGFLIEWMFYWIEASQIEFF